MIDGILAVWSDIDEEAEDDYTAWYEREHMFERLEVPGFRRARHYLTISGEPKYFTYFADVITRNGDSDAHLIGNAVSDADLSLFQVIAGLRYAYPVAMARIEPDYPALTALHGTVAARPNVAAYLASERRIPFNEMGIFRHYPELDG